MNHSRNARLLCLGALCTSAGAYVACGDDTSNSGGALDGGTTLDASVEASTTTDSSVTLDGSTPPPDAGKEAGPWCGALDSGALCPVGEWSASGADGGAATCKACPTAPIACATDFATLLSDGGVAPRLPVYDKVTKQLRVTIPAGRQQIVEVSNAEVAVSSCFGSGSATPQAVPVTLAGDVITFDLTAAAADAGSNVGPCGVIKVTVKDACCTTSTVTVTAFWDAEISQITSGGCGGDAG